MGRVPSVLSRAASRFAVAAPAAMMIALSPAPAADLVWKGPGGAERRAEFTAPRAWSREKRHRYADIDYQDKDLREAVSKAVERQFGDDVRLEVRSSREIAYAYRAGVDPKAVREAIDRTISERTWRVRRGAAWSIDYHRIAEDFSRDVAPLARSLFSKHKRDARALAAEVAHFVQGIEYRRPPDEFFLPTEVLARGFGDCDSKAALAGALLRSASPRLRTVYVETKDHVVLGVAAPARPGDAVVRVAGRRYVLVEVAASWWALGAVAEETLAEIRAGRARAVVPDGEPLPVRLS